MRILMVKKKSKKERVRSVCKFALIIGVVTIVGIGTGIILAPESGKELRKKIKKSTVDTIQTIKNTVQKSAESTKDSIDFVAQDISDVIEGVYLKAENINQDLKDSGHHITHDMHKTARKISKEIKKPI